MKFNKLSTYFKRLESVSSRIAMTEIVAELYREIQSQKKQTNEIIETVTYMLMGSVVPAYHKLEFNFSVKLLLKTIASQGVGENIEQQYAQLGDIGNLAYEIYKKNKSGELDVLEVHKELIAMANLSGTDSQKNKGRCFIKLSKQLSAEELKYISRLIVGKLRLGLSSKTIIDAISWTLAGDKSSSKQIEHLFGITSDLGVLARRIFTEGLSNVEESTQVTPGIPVASKLVQRSLSSKDVYERLGESLMQPKLDGLRMQIHLNKDGIEDLYSKNDNTLKLFNNVQKDIVKIFSRNLEDITDMFPDIVKAISKLDLKAGVFDSEAIGFDPVTKKYLPFQETIKRKRKYDVSRVIDEIPIQVNIFDILFINRGLKKQINLLHENLKDRMLILEEVFNNIKIPEIKVLDNIIAKSATEIETYFNKNISKGFEGIIAKSIESIYKPGTRNYDWIKLKSSSKDGVADTIDAVVLGYYFGSGSRSKLGIGALLLGTYDDAKESFIALSKLGTGVTEDEWRTIKTKLDTIKLSKLPNNVLVNKVLMPDIIVSPEVVVVVEADEVSLSKINSIDKKVGYSLRFPRLKVFDRDDKDVSQITNIEELESLYKLRNN